MSKPLKNYVVFVNDHSGSMGSIADAAIADYNANIKATKDAASAEMLDTVVCVIGFGLRHTKVERQVQISNPHVLRPVTTWKCEGMTPLYDGIDEGIKLIESLPDAGESHVSVLFISTTDGGENDSNISATQLRQKIERLQNTKRWTFTFRVPNGQEGQVSHLGVSSGNIQGWDTTKEGMAVAQAQTESALRGFYSARASGQTSSSVFYSSAANVNTAALTDISKETSFYICGEKIEDFDGIQIKDFILARRQQYLIGAAFYQLVKTEARVQPTKLILIREKSTGKVYAGNEARKMIGLDTVNNARLHPNHGGTNYDIFIQSESVNRKIGTGHGVLYWAVKGRPMTQADLDKYAGQNKPVAPVVKLAEAPATGRPTPSTIPVTPKPASSGVNGKPVVWFSKRQDARDYGAKLSPKQFVKDGNDFNNVRGLKGERWFVFTA